MSKTKPSAKRLHVTFVRGPIISTERALNNPAVPSISIAYLTSYVRRLGHEVDWVDAIADGLDEYWPIKEYPTYLGTGLTVDEIVSRIPEKTDVIAINAMFSGEWPITRIMIKAIRQRFPDVRIIAGGEHITALTEFSLKDCPELDVCVRGEGEHILGELLTAWSEGGDGLSVAGTSHLDSQGNYVENGGLLRNREIDDIPWPEWPEGYLEKFWAAGKSAGAGFDRDIPMMMSRGCPYQCTFCSNPNMWTTRYILREPTDVIAEIKHYIEKYDISSIQLFDLTAITKKKWLVDFCNRILDEKIELKWSVPQGTRSEILDEESLSLLHKTGCHYLVYAPESGSPKTLERIKKRVSLDRLMQSAMTARRLGIVVRFNLIIGFPGESRWDVLRTAAFGLYAAIRGVDEVSVNLFSPYPGSELFEEQMAANKVSLTDKYFLQLTSLNSEYSALNPLIVNERMGPLELGLYRIMLMVTNYALGYLIYPKRILRTFRNLKSDEAATVFEQRIRDFLRNRLTYLRATSKS